MLVAIVIVLAVVVVVASTLGDTSRVVRCGSNCRNRSASLVINDEVLAVLLGHLSRRDGEQHALNCVVDHSENKCLALAIGVASVLACLSGLNVGRLLKRGLGTAGSRSRAAGVASKKRRAGDGVDGSESSKDGSEGLHFEVCVEWLIEEEIELEVVKVVKEAGGCCLKEEIGVLTEVVSILESILDSLYTRLVSYIQTSLSLQT